MSYLYCMKNKLKSIFNKRIFREVDFEKIAYGNRANFVMEKVFDWGEVDDIPDCRQHYSEMKVSEALLNAKFLPETTMHLATADINKPLKYFRC